MDVLTVGGKEYIKASVIARELGYTSDYVGQLCRSRKVNAKLVGRSWYVDTDSIQSHKSTRYRSTHTTTARELKEELAKKPSERKVIVAPSNFYAHNKPEPKISYEIDQSELIPAVTKVDLPVELADAQAVSVNSEGDRYHFVTPKVPVIKFKGTLQVTNYVSAPDTQEAQSSESDDSSRHIHPKVSKAEGKKKAQNIVISSIFKKSPAKTLQASKATASTTLVAEEVAVASRPMSFAQRVSQTSSSHVEVDLVEDGVRVHASFIFGAVAFGALFAVLCFGLQANILIENQVAVTTYSFGLQHLNLSASSYDAFESFKGTLYLMKFSTNFFIF